MSEAQPAPRRIYRLTFTMADGRRFWRYIRCPYQVRNPADWQDSLLGVQTRLADLVLKGAVDRFAISAVDAARTHEAAERSLRFHEIDVLAAA